MSEHIHEAAIFAENVRRELRALPAEVVADLTDGLEADISSSLADGATLPTASEYATDLLRGAGLELSSNGRTAQTFIHRMSEKIRPLWTRLRSWATGLAPAWWVLRAWVIMQIIGWWVSEADETRPFILHWGEMPLAGVVVFVIALVLSVRWGRSSQTRWVYATYASHLILIAATFGMLFAQPKGDPWASWAPPGNDGYPLLQNCATPPRVIGMQAGGAQRVLDGKGFDYKFLDIGGNAVLSVVPPDSIVVAQSPEADNPDCQGRVQLFFNLEVTPSGYATVAPGLVPTTTVAALAPDIATTTVTPNAVATPPPLVSTSTVPKSTTTTSKATTTTRP